MHNVEVELAVTNAAAKFKFVHLAGSFYTFKSLVFPPKLWPTCNMLNIVVETPPGKNRVNILMKCKHHSDLFQAV